MGGGARFFGGDLPWRVLYVCVPSYGHPTRPPAPCQTDCEQCGFGGRVRGLVFRQYLIDCGQNGVMRIDTPYHTDCGQYGFGRRGTGLDFSAGTHHDGMMGTVPLPDRLMRIDRHTCVFLAQQNPMIVGSSGARGVAPVTSHLDGIQG